MSAPGSDYAPGMTGWVVRSETPLPRGTAVAWWYGPGSGWGTTYGPLASGGVKVWRLRRQAIVALLRVYGSPPVHVRVQKVEEAEAESSGAR